MRTLQQNIESVIFDGNLEEINRRLTALQEELLRLANERKSYSAVADEIDTLREQREKCMKESAAAQGIKQRIECVRDFLKSHSEELEETLAVCRSCGIARDDLKAVLTPHNALWNVLMLSQELMKEHEQMKRLNR